MNSNYIEILKEYIDLINLQKTSSQIKQREEFKNLAWFFDFSEVKLPENWLVLNILDVTWLVTCGVAKKPNYIDNGIPFLSAQNARPFKTNTDKIKYISEKDFKTLTVGGKPQKNDILYTRVGNCGEAAKNPYEFDFAIYVSLTLIKPIHELINSDYLVAFLNSDYGFCQANVGAIGTGLKNLNVNNVRKFKIPLPPLAEQNRIVAKLDSLFAQLEMMKTSMAAIPVLLKNFRQQVLTQAVTGKLTESWRVGKELESAEFLFDKIDNYFSKNKKRKTVSVSSENYSKVPATWKKCFIGDISDVSNGSTPSRKEDKYWNGHIAWIGSAFIQNNRIAQVKEFITDEGFKNSSVKILPKGTVLMAMIGEGKTRAQSAILDIEATINQNIASLSIEHGFVLPEFLQYYLISNYEKHRLVGNGTGPQALNGQKVRDLEFVLAPFVEQQEIVSRVESLFAKADAIEKQYKILKQKIETLPQAMLHKAFKGELVEQLVSDGDARELLKEIQELRAHIAAVGKKKVVGKKVKEYKDGEAVLGMVAEVNTDFKKK